MAASGTLGCNIGIFIMLLDRYFENVFFHSACFIAEFPVSTPKFEMVRSMW